jgi:hypothetical protein
VHWTEVPTDLLRTTGRALGGSANDVHLAALGHAMATWAGEHWPALSRADVPIMVPLNLRHPGQVGLAGNQFFLSRITVPGGQAAPLRRLAGTITATTPLKSIPHRVALGRALELLPRPLLDLVTGVCTTPDQLSVVGSCFALRHPLRFRDDPVERVAPLICCPDGFPATVALFLYQDVSTACFHLDEALPAAETIPDHWRAAVNEMAAAVSVRAEPVA